MDSSGTPDVAETTNEIPKFNLADQIMAEQRKITAVRRKAPIRKNKPPNQQPRIKSISYDVEPPRVLSKKERIIEDIVARDIDKLCRGDFSGLRNW
jgi:hypothetical protein